MLRIVWSLRDNKEIYRKEIARILSISYICLVRPPLTESRSKERKFWTHSIHRRISSEKRIFDYSYDLFHRSFDSYVTLKEKKRLISIGKRIFDSWSVYISCKWKKKKWILFCCDTRKILNFGSCIMASCFDQKKEGRHFIVLDKKHLKYGFFEAFL